MNRYLLFAGYQYYPQRAWRDLVDSYETQEEAEREGRMLITEGNDDWFQVVDINQGVVVCEESRDEAR